MPKKVVIKPDSIKITPFKKARPDKEINAPKKGNKKDK